MVHYQLQVEKCQPLLAGHRVSVMPDIQSYSYTSSSWYNYTECTTYKTQDKL
jgi:hypothetical protein